MEDEDWNRPVGPPPDEDDDDDGDVEVEEEDGDDGRGADLEETANVRNTLSIVRPSPELRIPSTTANGEAAASNGNGKQRASGDQRLL